MAQLALLRTQILESLGSDHLGRLLCASICIAFSTNHVVASIDYGCPSSDRWEQDKVQWCATHDARSEESQG
jgi:hypothetical protein